MRKPDMHTCCLLICYFKCKKAIERLIFLKLDGLVSGLIVG